MELRSCSNLHFVRTTRNGSVVKVRNVDSRGKPILVFKNLKEIYGMDDAERLGSSFPNYSQVKSETPCLPVVDRTLAEVKPETYGFCPRADDDGIDNDLDDHTTLKQLRKKFKTKKRKLESASVNLNQVNEILKSDEDESDLNEPIIRWKSKCTKKSKVKRKCMDVGFVATISEISVPIKSEQIQCSECPMQIDVDMPPVLSIKDELPEPELIGCRSTILFSDDSSSTYNEESCHTGVTSLTSGFKNCVTNEVSYDHLDHVNSSSMLLPSGGEGVNVNGKKVSCNNSDHVNFSSMVLSREEEGVNVNGTEKNCEVVASSSQPQGIMDIQQVLSQGSPLELPNPILEKSSDICSHSGSSSGLEQMSRCNSENTELQNPDLADNKINSKKLHRVNFYCFSDKATESHPSNKQGACLSDLDNKSAGYLNSSVSSGQDAGSVSLKDSATGIGWTPAYGYAAIAGKCTDSGKYSEDELFSTEKSDPEIAPTVKVERDVCTETQSCDISVINPTPELQQVPARLPLTRTAISPSSQEHLCLAMNPEELHDDVDKYKCKEKLVFGKLTDNMASSEESVLKHMSRTENHEMPGQIGHQGVKASPKELNKRSQNGKRNSPPKGNLEGPRYSRSLPNLSTGCTSIKGFSESAIAFSQRQIQDVESLALKLMNELKSMKDIVEEKLLFEAYRHSSLRNDADEVRTAINSATKVEEITKKWLSMMARDCTRFCKIMKLSQDDIPASNNAASKERKKITFADEAGGELCHVKFFEDGMTSAVSDRVEK